MELLTHAQCTVSALCLSEASRKLPAIEQWSLSGNANRIPPVSQFLQEIKPIAEWKGKCR